MERSNRQIIIEYPTLFLKIPQMIDERPLNLGRTKMEGGDAPKSTKRWTKSAGSLEKVKASSTSPSSSTVTGRNSALFGAAKRASPLVLPPGGGIATAGSDSRTVFTGVRDEKALGRLRAAERRGTGVRRGCVHGLTIGNQTPFNAPSRCNPWRVCACVCVCVCVRVCG